MNYKLSSVITGICSIAAGILHTTVIAQLHWTAFPPLEGLFFIAGGLFQMALGTLFISIPTVNTYRAGLLVNGGMGSLYILLQFLPVPFANGPESITTLGFLVTTLEIIAVTTSLHWILTHTIHREDRGVLRTIALASLVIVLGGFGSYGGAQSTAMLFPNRSIEHNHDHGSHKDEPPEMPHNESDHEEEIHHDDEHHGDINK